jgi:hypothetical protein
MKPAIGAEAAGERRLRAGVARTVNVCVSASPVLAGLPARTRF